MLYTKSSRANFIYKYNVRCRIKKEKDFQSAIPSTHILPVEAIAIILPRSCCPHKARAFFVFHTNGVVGQCSLHSCEWTVKRNQQKSNVLQYQSNETGPTTGIPTSTISHIWYPFYG